ncbi:NADPH-dependent 7-cyano-7-deazaguanine reductase QueF [PVC group bacterium (ex Bugula neritina AB1)]|nr:NADPH-dependent 7-cyano-7-deazaguanine reductase QueF [PVC group bacterium (ex Bugula neritina AB1)]
MEKKTYQNAQGDLSNLQTPDIEVWENQYKDRDYTVSFELAEFTCVCPKTGLPDFATLYLNYVPEKWCIELKSFKMYILFYRDIGIFHEHFVNKILDDIVKACSPRSASLKAIVNTRGGILTTVESIYPYK